MGQRERSGGKKGRKPEIKKRRREGGIEAAKGNMEQRWGAQRYSKGKERKKIGLRGEKYILGLFLSLSGSS